MAVSFRAEPVSWSPRRAAVRVGKTTISQLVSRMYDASSGQVLVGDHDVREVTPAVAPGPDQVVTATPHEFHDTIRANLVYAAPSRRTEAQLWAALAGGPDRTSRGSRCPMGSTRTRATARYRRPGGEKQRLAVARLPLKAPCPSSILDEAAAASRRQSPKVALRYRPLTEALTGRVRRLAIAHRSSTVSRCLIGSWSSTVARIGGKRDAPAAGRQPGCTRSCTKRSSSASHRLPGHATISV